MCRSRLPLRFEVDGRVAEGETLLAEDTGPSVVVLTTNLAALGLSLTTTYLGDDCADHTLVGELVRLGDACSPPRLERRVLGLDGAPFVYERRAFLYDHLFRVADSALDLGVPLTILGAGSGARAIDPLAAR